MLSALVVLIAFCISLNTVESGLDVVNAANGIYNQNGRLVKRVKDSNGKVRYETYYGNAGGRSSSSSHSEEENVHLTNEQKWDKFIRYEKKHPRSPPFGCAAVTLGEIGVCSAPCWHAQYGSCSGSCISKYLGTIDAFARNSICENETKCKSACYFPKDK